MPELIPYKDFAAKIKELDSSHAGTEDYELVNDFIVNHPEWKDRINLDVDFKPSVEGLKKKSEPVQKDSQELLPNGTEASSDSPITHEGVDYAPTIFEDIQKGVESQSFVKEAKEEEIKKVEAQDRADAYKAFADEAKPQIENTLTRLDSIEDTFKSSQSSFDDMIRGAREASGMEGDQGAYINKLYGDKAAALRSLRDTKKVLGSAKEFMDAPTEEGMKAFWGGMKSKGWTNILSLGLSDLYDGVNLMQLVKKHSSGKPLSEIEEEALNAAYLMQELRSGKEMPSSYNVGLGLAEMVPFLSQIALTKGLSSTVTKGVKEGLEGVVKNKLKKDINNAFVKHSIDASSFVTGKAAQASVMPLTGLDVSKRLTGTLEKGDDGEVKQVEGSASKPLEAVAKSVLNTTLELIVEGKVEGVISKGVSNVAKKMGANMVKAPKGSMIAKAQERIEMHDFVSEYFGENITGVSQSLLVGDNTLDELFNSKTQTEIFATSVLARGGFKALEVPGYLANKKKEDRVVKNQTKFKELIDDDTQNKIDQAIEHSDNLETFRGEMLESGVEAYDGEGQQVVFDYVVDRLDDENVRAIEEGQKEAEEEIALEEKAKIEGEKTSASVEKKVEAPKKEGAVKEVEVPKEVIKPKIEEDAKEEIKKEEVVEGKEPDVATEKESEKDIEGVLEEGFNKTLAQDQVKVVTDFMRKGKINKPGNFRASVGVDVVWDGSIELVAKALEGGAIVTDAIRTGLEHVKQSDWYKELGVKEQEDIVKGYESHLKKELSPVVSKKATQKKVEKEANVPSELRKDDGSTDDWKSLKFQIKQEVKASKEGFKAGVKEGKGQEKVRGDKFKEVKTSVVSHLKDKIKEQKKGDYYYNDLSRAVSSVERAKTPKSLESAIATIDDSFAKMARKDDVKDAAKQINKIKKSNKIYKNFSTQGHKVRSFTDINPRMVPTDKWEAYKQHVDELASFKDGEKSYDVKAFDAFTKDLKSDIAAKEEASITSRGEKNKMLNEAFAMKEGKDVSEVDAVAEIMKSNPVSEAYAKKIVSEAYSDTYKQKQAKKQESDEDVDTDEYDYLTKEEAKASIKGVSKVPSEGQKSMPLQEQSVIKDLSSITDQEMDSFTTKELNGIAKVLEKANSDGWYSPNAYIKYGRKLNGIRGNKKLEPVKAALRTKRPLLAQIKESVLKVDNKDSLVQKIENSPLYKLGNVMSMPQQKVAYKETVSRLARADAGFNKASKIVEDLGSVFKKDKGKVFDTTVRLEMYARQKEHEANGGEGNIVKDYLDATVSSKDEQNGTKYSKEALKRISEVYESIPKKGDGIDMDAFWKTLRPAEKAFYTKKMDISENDLREKQRIANEVYRGEEFEVVEEHSRITTEGHNNSDVEKKVGDFTSGKGRVSARSGSGISRTAGVNPIRFDFIGNTYKNIRETYFDYYLTPELQRNYDVFKEAKKDAEGLEKDWLNAIEESINNSVQNAYDKQYKQYSAIEETVKAIEKKGYESIFGTVRRVVPEVASNLVSAVSYNPSFMMNGLKGIEDVGPIMDVGNSTQKDRLGRDTSDIGAFDPKHSTREFDTPTMSLGKVGRFVMEENMIARASAAMTKFTVSTGDMMVGRPYWNGAFKKEFKDITGEEFDNKAFKEDKGYVKKHEEAIKEAVSGADFESNVMFNTSTGIEAAQRLKKDRGSMTPIHKINNFVMSFNINDTDNIVTGLKDVLTGEGGDRMKSGRLVLGLMGRQYLYTALRQAMYSLLQAGVMEVFGDEEQQKEAWANVNPFDNTGRDAIGTLLSVGFGKMGQIPKAFVAAGVNYLGKEYKELNKGEEYDGFKDQVMYDPVNDIKSTKDLLGMTGALGIPLKNAYEAVDLLKGRNYKNSKLDWANMIGGIAQIAPGLPLGADVKATLNTISRSHVTKFRVESLFDQAIENDYSGEQVTKEMEKIYKSLDKKDKEKFKSSLPLYKKTYKYEKLKAEGKLGKIIPSKILDSRTSNEDKAKYLYKLRKRAGDQKAFDKQVWNVSKERQDVALVSQALWDDYKEIVAKNK